MKCQCTGRSPSTSIFPSASCRYFPPNSVTPAVAACLMDSAALALVTATSVTAAGSRPAAFAASFIRDRTWFTLSVRFCGPINILGDDTLLYTADGLIQPDLGAVNGG